MFFLDRESALASCEKETDDLYLWRYIPHYKYKSENGVFHAKPSAFSIRRDENGIPREPSASLFELLGHPGTNMGNSIVLLSALIAHKNFRNVEPNDAAGSLKNSDLNELNKDPRVFSLSKTAGKPVDCLIHWDLKYAADDKTEEIQVAKSALAHVCKVYVCGERAKRCIT